MLEYHVIEDISSASIINQNPMSVVVPYLYANNECIIVGVVETSSIFLQEPNYGVVDPCLFWNESC